MTLSREAMIDRAVRNAVSKSAFGLFEPEFIASYWKYEIWDEFSRLMRGEEG